eukprot:gene19692-26382_t
MPIIIPIDAGIAVGKTTLLARIKEQVASVDFGRPCVVEFEPVDKWMQTKPAGHEESLFEMYYKDKQKYGFTFQMLALQTRFQRLKEVMDANPNSIIICERSPLTDREIFARMLCVHGIISPYEFQIYDAWYDFVMGILRPCIKGIVYLRANPDVCAGRLAKRNRLGEDMIDIAYLKKLHDRHDMWLLGTSLGFPVLVVNGNCGQGDVNIDSIMMFVRGLVLV